MNVEYQVAEYKTGDYRRRMSLEEVMDFLKLRIEKPNQVRLQTEDQNVPGPLLPRLVALERGENRLSKARPGFKIAFLPEKGAKDWIVRVVRDFRPTDTAGTDAVDRIWTATYDRWDGVYNVLDLGICASKPGQHLHCNAWDGGVGNPKTADDIHKAILTVANWMRVKMLEDMQGEPSGLPILGIIVMSQWCSRESTNWSHYGGTPHVSHWHVSGYPSRYPGWI